MSLEFEKTLDVSREVYSLGAIKKAAYRFSDRLFLRIEDAGPTITISARAKADGADVELLLADLLNEILDQDLRESIAKETEPLRNLIVAHALSHVALLHPELENEEFREAPELARKVPSP